MRTNAVGETEGEKETWELGRVFWGGEKRGVNRLNGGNCKEAENFWAVFPWQSFLFFVSIFFAKTSEINFFFFKLYFLSCIECCDLLFSSVPSSATLLHHTLPWRRLTMNRWLLLENIELDGNIHKPLDCFLTSILESLAAL